MVARSRNRSVVPGFTQVSFVSASGAWTNMPVAETEYGSLNYVRLAIDLSQFTHVSLRSGVGTAGAANAVLRVQYSTDSGVTWSSLGAGNTPSISIGTTGAKSSGWVTIASGARREVLMRIVGAGGDAAADPRFWNLALRLRRVPGISHHKQARVLPVNLTSVATTWTNMPAAETELSSFEGSRTLVDLSAVSHVRLTVGVAAVGAAGAVLRVQYSTDSGVTWNSLGAGNTPSVSISSLGTIMSGWIPVVPGARRDVLLRVVGSGGNAVADPTITTILLSLRDLRSTAIENILLLFLSTTWNNMPAAETEVFGITAYRAYVVLSGFSQIQFRADIGTAGAANAVLRVQYSTDSGVTWSSLGAGNTPSISIGTTGAKSSGWVTIASGARREVLLRIVGVNGNGAADPVIRQVYYRLR